MKTKNSKIPHCKTLSLAFEFCKKKLEKFVTVNDLLPL